MDVALAKLARVPEIEVEFDDKLGVAIPGTTFTGRVLLKKPLSSDAESFKLSLLGSIRIYMSAGAYSKHDKSDSVLDLEYDLGTLGDTTEFPFAFMIPEDTMPSIRMSKHSHVQYELSAKLSRRGIRADVAKKWPLRMLAAQQKDVDQVSTVHARVKLPFPVTSSAVAFETSEHDQSDYLPRYIDREPSVRDSPPASRTNSESNSQSGSDTASTVFDSPPPRDTKAPIVTHSVPVGGEPGPSSSAIYELSLDLEGRANSLTSNTLLPIRFVMFPTSPMPPIKLTICRVMLLQKTYLMLDDFKHIDRIDHELVHWRGETAVQPAAEVDYTSMFRDAILPEDLVPTFAGRLVGRSYELMVMVSFASVETGHSHRAVMRMPVKVIA